MKTLMNIRAPRRFAYRVQPLLPKLRFQGMYRLEMCSSFAQPLGQPGTHLDRLWPANLNKLLPCHEPSF